MRIKCIASVLMTLSISLSLGAETLTIQDYCDIKRSAPASIREMRPMADGVSYTALSEDGNAIEIYSYRDGKKTGTLFAIDDVKGDLKIDHFDGYKLSRNEKKILLWNDKQGIYRYSFRAEYYVYDIMRSTLKRVSTGGRQRNATLSHDGRMVAYERDNNIFISNLDYGTDKAITSDGEAKKIIYGSPDWSYEEEFGMQSTIRWSEDDNVLAFVRFDESEVPEYCFDDYQGFCDPDPLGDPYPAEFSYKYPLAGYPNSKVSVLAYDLNTLKTKTMDIPMKETDYIPAISFGGTGAEERLMVMVLNRDQNDLHLYSVNTGSTVAREIYSDQSRAWLDPLTYQMVKYGKTSFIIGSQRSGWRHLYEYDYSGNLLRQITSGDYNVTALYGKDKAGNVYVQTTSLGAINRNVAKVDAKGKLTLLHPEEGTEKASFSKDFSYYVRTYSNANTPPQYTLWATKGNKIADLELNEAYAAHYAAAPKKEFIKILNDDGQEMDAFIMRPTDFDPNRKYPLLMEQYNGPDSQLVLNNWKIDGLYYLCQGGYVVATVDGRGTGNRSRDWAYAVYCDLGKYETRDQLAAARWLASQPYIDSERMACFGWSYGGYMTLMELTDTSSPFKAGVAMAAVADWRYYDTIYTERFMLTPQQNEAGYNNSSTLPRSENLKGRLLIMSGTNDDNVHFYNTLKFTSKIGFEGKVFDMMVFTGFEHSLRMCNARQQLYAKVLDFLNTNVKNK